MNDEKPLREFIVEAISARDLDLPVLNPVAMQLQKALHDENAKIADIEQMIIADQALASQILRMANSSFFKGMQQITTIRKAILRLGMQQVVNLAMTVLQRNVYRSHGKLLHRYMEKLWQHAFASALGCQWTAECCGYKSEADTAFLAGLLHNIGQLVILQVLEQAGAQRAITAQLPDSLIIELLSSDLHAEQGYRLMQQWNLPEEYCVIARDHHREVDIKSPILVTIVRLLDQACDKVGIGLHHEPEHVLAASAEAQILGITEVRLAELEILLEDSVHLAG